MRLLRILYRTVTIYLCNIQPVDCSIISLVCPLINTEEFVYIDNLITTTSAIADPNIPAFGEYSLITKDELSAHVSLIRYNSEKHAISLYKNISVNFLILCSIIEGWISCIDNKSCNGTFIRIARYIFAVNDILDVAKAKEKNYVLLNDLMIDVMNLMTLPTSLMSYLHDRKSTITSIRDILGKIDDNLSEALEESPNSGEKTSEKTKLLKIIGYILSSVHNIKLLINNCYILNHHLKDILHSTTTLFDLYELTISQQFDGSLIYDRISEIDYMQMYMNKTKQLRYIGNITNQINFELTFFCSIMMYQSDQFVKEKICYLSLLLDLICNLKIEYGENSSEELIVFYNYAFRLYEDLLWTIKNDESVGLGPIKMPNFHSRIGNVINAIYEKFGYSRNNLRIFLKDCNHDWELLINDLKAASNVFKVKTYCFLFSLVTIIKKDNIAISDLPKYILTTFLELNNLCLEPNGTLLQDIVCESKHKLPQMYYLYLWTFTSFANSLHEVEYVFAKLSPALLNDVNTFFKNSIQKICLYKLPFANYDFEYAYRSYVAISDDFLNIFRVPIRGDNTFKKLAMLLTRLVHFHTKHSGRVDKNYETANLLYKDLLELKLDRKTEFIENINLKFIILSINYCTYKNLRNENHYSKRSSKNITTSVNPKCNNSNNQIGNRYCQISFACMNCKPCRDEAIEYANVCILDYFYDYLTLESDDKYKISATILEGYYLIFSDTPKFREFGEFLLFTAKANIGSSEKISHISNALAFIKTLKTRRILKWLQNKEKIETIVNELLLVMPLYASR